MSHANFTCTHALIWIQACNRKIYFSELSNSSRLKGFQTPLGISFLLWHGQDHSGAGGLVWSESRRVYSEETCLYNCLPPIPVLVLRIHGVLRAGEGNASHCLISPHNGMRSILQSLALKLTLLWWLCTFICLVIHVQTSLWANVPQMRLIKYHRASI